MKEYFENIGFSALNFTDSRSIYQFYDLSHLWEHVEIALKKGVKKLNTATEPISVRELYNELCGKNFNNELNKEPFNYNYKTQHADIFNGKDGYIYNKDEVIRQIKEFVKYEINSD